MNRITYWQAATAAMALLGGWALATRRTHYGTRRAITRYGPTGEQAWQVAGYRPRQAIRLGRTMYAWDALDAEEGR